MLLWFIIFILTGVVVAVITRPLLNKNGNDGDLGSPDAGHLNVYKDQLAEIERDLARDVIGEAEAATARLELSRRLLAH